MRYSEDILVERLDRQTFFETAWEYEPGEHVSFIGPTGSGKTTLAYQLLKRTATKEVPAVVLVMKPRDPVAKSFSKEAGFRIVDTWPPPVPFIPPYKRPGLVLWPKHTQDPDFDDQRHAEIFTDAIRQSYLKGSRILFADEMYSLTKELRLERELRRVWTKGRSMECGLWAATQRPADVPLLMYNSPEHIFLAYDPDRRAQDRFSEIGGVDPDLIIEVVRALPIYEWLYIRRSDRTVCVIGP